MPGSERWLKLAMIGDGPLREQAARLLADAGLAQNAWLPGNRNDVPRVMRGFDLFVLPSLAEGVSNTILEAMATGLPVVATAVGGNTELVEEGVTGTLVAPDDPGGWPPRCVHTPRTGIGAGATAPRRSRRSKRGSGWTPW